MPLILRSKADIEALRELARSMSVRLLRERRHLIIAVLYLKLQEKLRLLGYKRVGHTYMCIGQEALCSKEPEALQAIIDHIVDELNKLPNNILEALYNNIAGRREHA